MQTRWRLWIGLCLSMLTGAVSVLLLFMQYAEGNRIAGRLTKGCLLRLRPGMSEEEVLATIGVPLFEHHYHGSNLGTQLSDDWNKVIWQYAYPEFMGSGFAAYVIFEFDRVASIDLE